MPSKTDSHPVSGDPKKPLRTSFEIGDNGVSIMKTNDLLSIFRQNCQKKVKKSLVFG